MNVFVFAREARWGIDVKIQDLLSSDYGYMYRFKPLRSDRLFVQKYISDIFTESINTICKARAKLAFENFDL